MTTHQVYFLTVDLPEGLSFAEMVVMPRNQEVYLHIHEKEPKQAVFFGMLVKVWSTDVIISLVKIGPSCTEVG